jgi:SET domain-containing protein
VFRKHHLNQDEEDEYAAQNSILRHVFQDESLFVVDAQDRGNIGRFFNHSCDPNMEVQMIFHDTHDLRLPLIAFFTCVDIEAGTELCWNYGYVAGSVSGKAIDCCCGAATCVGRIL